MEIEFLRHFGFSSKHINTLKEAYGKNLLPLQQRVIKEGKLFEGHNILISAPTSSGKTFLAEILFLFHVLQGKNVVLLVPTKALANQRYHQLKNRYAEMGYDIVISTRDHPFHDRRIMEGRFHLAIVIYEKMRSIISIDDSFVPFLGACVVDEIHYLYHHQRGAELELLLTKLLVEKNLQLLGLSAIIDDEKAAEWLRAIFIKDTQRPVELRQGVLCQDRFKYVEFNTGQQGSETFPFEENYDEGLAMVEAGLHFASKGETTLLFWENRQQCYIAARKFAEHLKPEYKLKEHKLKRLETTSMKQFLSQLLPRRIAVHTSDLTQDEREWVEQKVQEGEVVLICATSTLAEGINFPVMNVLTTRRIYGFRRKDLIHTTHPGKIPITRERLFNMTGRAGRLGFSEFGRGILVTTTKGDVDGLFTLFSQTRFDQMPPALSKENMKNVVLQSMNIHGFSTKNSILELLNHTLTHVHHLWPVDPAGTIESYLAGLTNKGFVSHEHERYFLTVLGSVVVKNGVSPYSALRLLDYIHSVEDRFPPENATLFTICLLDEISELFIPLSDREVRNNIWSAAFLNLFIEGQFNIPSSIAELLNNKPALRKEHHAAFKKAILLQCWITGKPIHFLEEKFAVHLGTILRLGEETSWLMGCLAEIASRFEMPPDWLRKFSALQEQLLYGLPENGLEWSSFIRQRILNRSEVLALLKAGYHSPSVVHQDDISHLKKFLSVEAIEAIKNEKAMGKETSRISSDFVVELNNARPNQIKVNGVVFQLSKLLSTMIEILASTPGICVDYENLIQSMWTDSYGDKKKISRLKSDFLKRVEKQLNLPSPCNLIETIEGRGILLNATVKRE